MKDINCSLSPQKGQYSHQYQDYQVEHHSQVLDFSLPGGDCLKRYADCKGEIVIRKIKSDSQIFGNIINEVPKPNGVFLAEYFPQKSDACHPGSRPLI